MQYSTNYDPCKQVFLVHVKTLPAEDIEVIIGDNLAAHMSPFVTQLCAVNNIRFCFLPENSTHLAAPGHDTYRAYVKVVAGDPEGVEGGLRLQKHQLCDIAETGIPKGSEPADAERLL